jgi:hypothetical protein
METPQPEMLRFKLEQVGDELILRRRTGFIGVGVFVLVWLTFWTFGCVHLVRTLLVQPTPVQFLFAVPFWAAWVFAAWLLVQSFLGFEQIRIGPESLEVTTLFGRRRAPIDELRGVSRELKVVQGKRGETTQSFLKIAMAGEPISLGEGVSDEELEWLASVIRRQLNAWDPERTFETSQASLLKSSPRIEVLSPASGAPKPPSDCRIERSEDWDGTTYTRRGRFSLFTLAGITIAAVFWNGIVGIFILQQVQHFNWFMLFFMIPHEIIGLGIIVSWILVLVNPFRAERWTIGNGEVAARTSLFGLGWTRRWDPHDVGRVELRHNQKPPKRLFPTIETQEESYCRLALIGRDGADRLRIDALTEGDARWLGGEFCRLLKGSLSEPARDLVPQASLYDRWLDS